MSQFCDLHTHSHYSDGTFSPAEILAEAEKLGLSAVALTDHNTVEGLPEFLSSARGSSVRAIAGVEISTGYLEKELHIVGLFLPTERFEEIMKFLEVINCRKEESNRKLIDNFCRAGFPLDYDAIRAAHPQGTVNRAVIAEALLEKGYVGSVQEAFHTLLSKKQGYFIPPERIPVLEAIEFLRSLGAVSVLAHPFLNLTAEELRVFLPEAKQHGLTAMETHYSKFSPEETALARSIAREFDIAESGGSDFHGDVKPGIFLGTGRGDLKVPAEFVSILEGKAGTSQ